jgi:putative transposase
MDLGQIYDYTATISGWKHLLKLDKYKDMIIESLQYLVKGGKLKVYAFVIMPNHFHVIMFIPQQDFD